MRFEPKLIETDPAPLDENGEIVLTPEMEELAVRLRREADWLVESCLHESAESRPPREKGLSEKTKSVGLRSPAFWFCAAAASAAGLTVLLLLVVWGGVAVYERAFSRTVFPRMGVRGGGAESATEVVRRDAAADPSLIAPPAGTPAVSIDVDSRPVAAVGTHDARLPVVAEPDSADHLLLEVTGPELEGLLDLMEGESEESRQLSI